MPIFDWVKRFPLEQTLFRLMKGRSIMKKNLFAILLSALMLTSLLSACSTKNETLEENTAETTAAPAEESAEPILTETTETSPEIEETPEADSGADLVALDPANAQSLLNAPIENTTEQGENYSILLSYPVFGSTNLDAALQNALSAQSDRFKADVNDTEALEGEKFLLTSQSELYAGGTRYITVKIDSAWDMGGAHPIPYIETLCYDLQADKSLVLTDIFKQDSNYLELLSELCKDALLINNPSLTDVLDEGGLSPDVESFSRFALTDDGLMIFFPPYQVASYADGEQSVVLPYSELSELLSIETP